MSEPNEREPIPAGLRAFVLHRDRYTCQYCGAKAPRVELHVDHIIPVSYGGKNNFGNLITACQPCNIGKSNNFLKPRKYTFWESIRSVLLMEIKIMDIDEYLMLKSIQSGLMDGTIAFPKQQRIILRSPEDENGDDKLTPQPDKIEPVKPYFYRGREYFSELAIIVGFIGLVASLVGMVIL